MFERVRATTPPRTQHRDPVWQAAAAQRAAAQAAAAERAMAQAVAESATAAHEATMESTVPPSPPTPLARYAMEDDVAQSLLATANRLINAGSASSDDSYRSASGPSSPPAR